MNAAPQTTRPWREARGDHLGLIVIGHRGAAGYRPEHTLESYRLAIRMGADFIEPDLVATSDGVLVARHENEISSTTDVARRPEFAHLKADKRVDGKRVTGWFTEDFTLAQLRTLRARERIPGVRPANTRFDGMYPIPTFAEIIQLAQRESRPGHVVGIYPETKHPTYFASEGRHIDGSPIAISLGAKLVETLVAEGFTDPARVYIQSFEVGNLIELAQRIMPAAGICFPLVQLYGDLCSSGPYDIAYNAHNGANLATIYAGLADTIDGGLQADTQYKTLASRPALEWMKAHFASGIGPWKDNLLPRGSKSSRDVSPKVGRAMCGRDVVVHPMLAHALDAGLLVHPYTVRAEEQFLARTPDGGFQSALAEAVQLYALGAQGLFIDQPDIGVAARDIFLDRDRDRDYEHDYEHDREMPPRMR